MASTWVGQQLTAYHMRQQGELVQALALEAVTLWPLLDPTRVSATVDGWAAAMLRLLEGMHEQSVAVSADYFEHFRAAETQADPLPGDAYADLPTLNRQAAATSLRATGPYNLLRRYGDGESLESASQKALVDVTGAATRHVLNGGRGTVREMTRRDKTALAWARVTDADPCSWCAMLASRGAVYESEQSALATTERSPRGKGLPYHDGCQCSAEPIYYKNDQYLPGRAMEFGQLWATATEGYSGHQATLAFRRAYEEQYGSWRSRHNVG